MSDPVTLRVLLGNYPVTRALRRGEVGSPIVRMDFADVKSASTAFKRVVRSLEFDDPSTGATPKSEPTVPAAAKEVS